MAAFEVDYRNHTEPFDTKEEAMTRAKKVSKSEVYPVIVRDSESEEVAVFKHGKRVT